MYNRYIRNDNGQYERVPVQETGGSPPPPPPSYEEPAPPPPPPPPPPNNPPPKSEGKTGLLSGLLRRLRLEDIDTGDLLLLLILFLLFKDGEDEELLIALGLMLIL